MLRIYTEKVPQFCMLARELPFWSTGVIFVMHCEKEARLC